MHEFTSALPLVEMDYQTQFPGKTTEESMQAGVCRSVMYELEGYIRQMNALYPDLKIVDCSAIKLDFDKVLKNEIFARQKLVVEGLNNIIEYNAKN